MGSSLDSYGSYARTILGRCEDLISHAKPLHRVKITKPFWIGKTEVTQKQWELIMDTFPSHFRGDEMPVESVSWHECMSFCHKLTLSERTAKQIPDGYEYRLPTEAEWEYAARGGSSGNQGHEFSGSDYWDEVAWYFQNAKEQTHPVAQKKANAIGTYDMSGNVEEWCLDQCEDYTPNFTNDPVVVRGKEFPRAVRGGSWKGGLAMYCATFCRSYIEADHPGEDLGFRVVLAPIIENIGD